MDAQEAKKLTQESVARDLEDIFEKIREACSKCKNSIEIEIYDEEKLDVLTDILREKGYNVRSDYSYGSQYKCTIVKW